MKLELLLSCDDNTTCATGEIFADPMPADTPPLVNTVIARNTYSSLFVLPPGSYGYYFHVDGAGGKFTLSLRDAEDSASVASAPKTFDTKYGFYGKVYLFKVSP